MWNSPQDFDPLSPAFHANPYPCYAMLHEQSPVLFYPVWNAWFVVGYNDVSAALKEGRFGKDILTIMTPEELGLPETPEHLRPLNDMQDAWMLNRDPPDHTHLRTLVHKAFTPRTVERLRQRTQAITDELIDRVQAKGSMDLISEFALPLPIRIIAEMLGVPASDYMMLNVWSTALLHTVDMIKTPEILLRGVEATVEFSAYLRELIAARRKNPQDDLISALVAAEAENDTLTETEIIATCTLLLFAGYETTVNLIGNGMLALLHNPQQWEKLKADPSLVKSAVEELLRYDSPAQMTGRFVMEDMEFAGRSFKQGQSVIIMFGAANHDPSRFPEPGKLDVTRDPNPHIAFGSGIHFCIGAPLARMEGQIAFATLARRLPNLKLVSDDVRYRPIYVFRGLEALPVTF